MKKRAPQSHPNSSGSLKRLALIATAAGALAAASGVMLAPTPAMADFPEPAQAPISWEIDFTHRTPKRILVDVPGYGQPVAYWYMVYSVTNNTDEEIFFRPVVELLTRTGDVLVSNNNIPLSAFEAIDRRTRRRNLTQPQDMQGDLLIGEDRAKTGVAIWQEPMREMGTFDIFVGGLSGEIVRLTAPDGSDLLDEDGLPILVRKTKQLTFKIRGDAIDPGDDEVIQLQDKWIMR